MNQRKIKLIQAGMRLFAEKGYHKTSVQDITNKAGISKGAFYLSFESKEEFVGTAIKHFNNELKQKMNDVNEQGVSAKQSFIQQVDVLVVYVYKYREFIMMLLQENVSFGRHAEQLYQQMKTENFHWIKRNIEAIYGKQVEQYIFDMIIQFEGLLNGYLQWIVIDDILIDRARIGTFIIDRLDDLVYGMNTKKETPLVSEDDLSLTFDLLGKEHPNEEQIREIVIEMKEVIQQLELSEEQQGELLEAADILKSEQQKIIIQGLLAHFYPYKTLQKYCEQLARLFQIDLLKK